jgi:hypothetical protein
MRHLSSAAYSIFLGICVIVIGTSCKKEYITEEVSDRVEWPLMVRYDSVGDATPVIQADIGDVDTISLIFDTGSPGIRILQGAVKDVLYEVIRTRVGASFGTSTPNVRFSGFVGRTSVAFGTVESRQPVSFMVIDSVQYGSGTWQSTGNATSIGASNLHGFSGLFGVSLRYDKSLKGIASPIAQLPGQGLFIVKFPSYGGAAGVVIINPDQSDFQGYTLFHLPADSAVLPGAGFQAWDDTKLYGCFVVGGTPYWAYSWLDTGNPDIKLSAPGVTSGNVAAGTTVSFGLSDALQETPFAVSTSLSLPRRWYMGTIS